MWVPVRVDGVDGVRELLPCSSFRHNETEALLTPNRSFGTIDCFLSLAEWTESGFGDDDGDAVSLSCISLEILHPFPVLTFIYDDLHNRVLDLRRKRILRSANRLSKISSSEANTNTTFNQESRAFSIHIIKVSYDSFIHAYSFTMCSSSHAMAHSHSFPIP